MEHLDYCEQQTGAFANDVLKASWNELDRQLYERSRDIRDNRQRTQQIEALQDVRFKVEQAAAGLASQNQLNYLRFRDLLPLRRWPTDRFVDLGKQIGAEYPDVTVVITGAPSEQTEAARVAAAIGSESHIEAPKLAAKITSVRQAANPKATRLLTSENSSQPASSGGVHNVATAQQDNSTPTLIESPTASFTARKVVTGLGRATR